LQQEGGLPGIERGGDFDDRGLLIVGGLELFARLNQFVGNGNRLAVGIDLRPNVDVGRKG
jgi:hypothetical protein